MNTLNRYQRKYMWAKACVMAISAHYDEMEREYISSHQIVNRDGSTPPHIWALGSDSAFEKANKEFSSLFTELITEKTDAQNVLQKAEGRLIAYGLSIVPSEMYKKLKPEIARSTMVRQNFLGLILAMDATTAPPKS